VTRTQDFHVYVSSFSGKRIDVLRGDGATGELAHLQTQPLSGKGLAMTHSPDRRFLYAAVYADVGGAKEARYETFRIEPARGLLHPVGIVRAPAYMVHVSVDRGGRFLLGASEPSGLIAVSPIGARGIPQEAPADAIGALRRPHHILADASNRFVLVPCMGTDHVLQLRFDGRTGRLAPNAPAEIYLQAGAGPRHMAHHPSGRWVYLVNQHDGSLVAYGLDPERGVLNELGRDTVLPDDFEGGPRGAQIHVSADGRLLFVSERTGRAITGWKIDPASGRLSNRRITPCDVGVRCFDLDLAGRYLAIGGVNSDKAPSPHDVDAVAIYAIDPQTGALERRGGAPCGENPYWVEIVDLP
jgi:6-phosphogluconolactonase